MSKEELLFFMCLTTYFEGGNVHAPSDEAYVLCNALILWPIFCNLPAPSPMPFLQVDSPLAVADLWGIERKLHLPLPQPLTHPSFLWHRQHTFSWSNAADYFWVPVLHFKDRQRGRVWGTQRVWVLSSPLAWRAYSDACLFQLTSGRHLLQI